MAKAINGHCSTPKSAVVMAIVAHSRGAAIVWLSDVAYSLSYMLHRELSTLDRRCSQLRRTSSLSPDDPQPHDVGNLFVVVFNRRIELRLQWTRWCLMSCWCCTCLIKASLPSYTDSHRTVSMLHVAVYGFAVGKKQLTFTKSLYFVFYWLSFHQDIIFKLF